MLLYNYAADCVFGGVTYSHGSSFPAGDGCNTWLVLEMKSLCHSLVLLLYSSCSNGRVFCTEIACPPPSEYIKGLFPTRYILASKH